MCTTLLITVALTLALTGCIPIQQNTITGGKKYDDFGYYDDLGYGLLQIGALNKSKTIRLLASDSYAIGPHGNKYTIKSEPHTFDIESKYPYIRDRIYIIDNNNRQLKHLKNGNWKFVFNFETPEGKDNRTFDAKFWTFYYSPIIHGPPN